MNVLSIFMIPIIIFFGKHLGIEFLNEIIGVCIFSYELSEHFAKCYIILYSHTKHKSERSFGLHFHQ